MGRHRLATLADDISNASDRTILRAALLKFMDRICKNLLDLNSREGLFCVVTSLRRCRRNVEGSGSISLGAPEDLLFNVCTFGRVADHSMPLITRRSRGEISSKRQTRGKKSMQFARFVWTVGLLLVVGFAAFMVGCGSGTQQGSSTEGKATGKAFAEERKEAQQERKQAILERKQATRQGRQ